VLALSYAIKKPTNEPAEDLPSFKDLPHDSLGNLVELPSKNEDEFDQTQLEAVDPSTKTGG
jgi:hypothetical protein